MRAFTSKLFLLNLKPLTYRIQKRLLYERMEVRALYLGEMLQKVEVE